MLFMSLERYTETAELFYLSQLEFSHDTRLNQLKSIVYEIC